jgi:tetratricopeptide (TPR) repeat protein
MKKIFVAMLLMVAVTAVAQTASAPAQPAATAAQPTAQQNPAPPPPATQKKEIKDPAEYNAYVGAVQQTDAAAKVSGLEAFLTQYPNSVMKEDALELLMGAYQQTASQAKTPEAAQANQTKMLATAQKVLQVNPCNVRALALLTYTERALAEAGQNAQQNLADAGQNGVKGLQCLQTVTKPDGTPAPEWDKLKTQTAIIFNGAAGISAYGAKDYAKAEEYLRASVDGDPTNLRDVYPLALVYLTAGPAEKDVDGLFFIARAVNLAQGAGKDQIAKFGKNKFKNYHGSKEGWEKEWSDLVALTAGTPLPPANFTITKYVPPTPAEQAAEIVKSKAVKDMSFAEWQMVLSEGSPEDAEKVWSVLKGKPLLMEAHVISIDTSSKTATRLLLAGSQDDVDAKRADIDLTMSAVLSKIQMPKQDTEFKFGGTPISYVAKPFVMTMNDGALLAPKAPPKAPVHKKPVAH